VCARDIGTLGPVMSRVEACNWSLSRHMANPIKVSSDDPSHPPLSIEKALSSSAPLFFAPAMDRTPGVLTQWKVISVAQLVFITLPECQ